MVKKIKSLTAFLCDPAGEKMLCWTLKSVKCLLASWTKALLICGSFHRFSVHSLTCDISTNVTVTANRGFTCPIRCGSELECTIHISLEVVKWNISISWVEDYALYIKHAIFPITIQMHLQTHKSSKISPIPSMTLKLLHLEVLKERISLFWRGRGLGIKTQEEAHLFKWCAEPQVSRRWWRRGEMWGRAWVPWGPGG